MLSRRALFRRAILGAALLGIGVKELRNAQADTSDIELVNIRIPIADLPKAFQGYRIAFLADLHLGVWVLHEWIERAVALAMSAKPDLVLLGGDYVWVPEDNLFFKAGFIRNQRFNGLLYEDAAAAIFRELNQLLLPLKKAPDGVIGVLGNHDLWASPRACFEEFAGKAANLLVNDASVISRGEAQLRIWGTDDWLTGIPRYLPSNRAKNRIEILLTHNPDMAALVLKHENYYFDLALCGHTHGGQISIPGFGPPTYHIENPQFASGLARVGEQSVYTTRGVGLVELPYRIGVRPDVTILDLV